MNIHLGQKLIVNVTYERYFLLGLEESEASDEYSIRIDLDPHLILLLLKYCLSSYFRVTKL